MKAFKRLLAKNSWSPDKPRGVETLPGHTANVLAAAEALLEETGDAQLLALGLQPGTWGERFRRTVLLATFCHDLGKANDQFQTMVRDKSVGLQAIRHEALSLLIVQETALRRWIAAHVEKDMLNVILWAAAGHHRKFPPPQPRQGTGSTLSLLLGHPDFHQTLGVGTKWLGLSTPPPLDDIDWRLTGPMRPTKRLNRLAVDAAVYWDTCSEELRRFLAATKACVIAADVAGSALPKQGEKISHWIKGALRRRPTTEQLQKIVADRLGEKPLRPFQETLGRTKTRVVLAEAGCGSGKTLGAYVWAANCATGKRLFFSYPTTGTATEGFRDYLIEPTLDAKLVHGRATVDLDLLGVGDEGESADPLAALNAWSTLITSCTVDTVLGLIQNHRRGLYAWPALSKAAFVFDEIHAYDASLFASLLRFLTNCRGLPCLLMTASLPRSRRVALEKVLAAIGESLERVCGPSDLETLPRYEQLVGTDDPWKAIQSTFENNGKVLWVVNTVDRALKFADEALHRGIKPEPLVYHSRFRYEDRVRQHGRLITRFKEEGPVLAIATQVAEMSLDLSADLLITDMAPISSLIQRLGRLNRRVTSEVPIQPKPFLVIEPETEAPYKDTDHPSPFSQARLWLERLGWGKLSQADLARTWAELDHGDAVIPVNSAWFDGGFETTPRHLRESASGLMVVLEEDANEVKRGNIEAVRVCIPMIPPRNAKWMTWPEIAFARVPPRNLIAYDPQRGAQWIHH